MGLITNQDCYITGEKVLCVCDRAQDVTHSTWVHAAVKVYISGTSWPHVKTLSCGLIFKDSWKRCSLTLFTRWRFGGYNTPGKLLPGTIFSKTQCNWLNLARKLVTVPFLPSLNSDWYQIKSIIMNLLHSWDAPWFSKETGPVSIVPWFPWGQHTYKCQQWGERWWWLKGPTCRAGPQSFKISPIISWKLHKDEPQCAKRLMTHF